MSGEEDSLSEFLKGFGFDEEELAAVSDEIDSFRTIPGTTIKRYLNRIMNTIEEEDRQGDREAWFSKLGENPTGYPSVGLLSSDI